MQLGLVTSTQSTRCALPCVAQETSHTTKASLLCKPTAWPKAVWSTHKQSAIRNRRNLVKECSPTRAILQVDRPVNLDQPSEGLKQESTNAQDDQKYSWTKQWYPVAIAEDLETYKPNALTLLGKNLVIWMDKDSQWRCFDDVCPHRLVPLSEGRLETDGTLQCAYHGWRFDAEGTCTTIPQADSEQLQKAAGHPRACVPSYPVQVQHHLMWVWADASPNAQLECLSKQPAVVEELQQDDNVIYLHPWFMREMPFGHDILLENILDPSHVPFSHHGVIGDRNKVEPSTMHQLAPVDRHSGFQLGIEVHKNGTNRAQAGTGKMTKIKFEPPSLVKYSFGGPGMQMITYAAPMSPGRSRVFYCLVADKAKAPKGMKRVMALRPSWLKFANHFQRNEVLDGDNVFLHGQDTYLHSGADKKGYYMPTTMDKGIVSLRRWLGTLAGPIPWAGAGPADVWGKQPSRHEMLDRFNQHTKHCKNCSKALKVITQLQRAAVVAMAVAALGAAAAAGAGQTSRLVWGGVAFSAIVAAMAAWKLGQTRQKFIFTDYVQADH